MSKVAKWVVAGVMVAAGVALILTGNIATGVGLVVSGVSSLASQLLQPKGKPRQAAELTLQVGEVPRSAIFGESATAGSLMDAFNYGGKYGTDWEVLAIALADHRCDSLTGFYVNDEFVAFAGDGAVAGYNGQLEVYWREGTEDQSVPAVMTAHHDWTAADNFAGGAWVVVAYKADAPEAKSPTWPGGRPRFLWLPKGALCYVAREDGSLEGGEGTHRWDDPATREWTDNPIDCRYTWVRGLYACDRVGEPDMLLIGRGLSAVEAPPTATFAPANLCDEPVEGEPRYRADGSVYANETFIDVEEKFAAACGGIIVQRAGAVEIEPGEARSTVMAITDGDLLAGGSVEYNQGILSEADRDWVNTVIPRYVEPTQKWADHSAPIRRDVAHVFADGGPRESMLSLNLVKRAAQAGRIGEIARRMGRLWGRAKITLPPRFAALEEGDWISWTSARRFGGATKTFRIEAYNLDQKWHNTLQLREMSAAVYDDGDFLEDLAEASQQAAPPAIGAPPPDAWTLAAEMLDEGGAAIPILAITGAVEDAYARQVRFEYWRDDGSTSPEDVTDWIGAGTFGTGVTRREIASIAPGAVYYAAISYVVDGTPGERLIRGPVRAGTIVTHGGFIQPGTPGGAASLPGTYWLNPADGYRAYRRVAGSGLLAIGGDRILIGGNAIELAWTEASDQRLRDAYDIATDALASAAEAIDALDDLDDDGILTVDEKIRILIPKASQLEEGWFNLDALADDLGITAERTAAADARAAWLALLAAITPGWGDTSAPSPIARAGYDDALRAYGEALDALRLKIARTSVIVQWSPDGTTSWGSFTPGDRYMRISTDGGLTFGAAMLAIGEDGGVGAAGNFKQHVFKRAASAPATPSGGGIPSTWSDGPPAGSDPLWMSVGEQTSAGVLVGSWSAPIRLDGEAGDPGADAKLLFVIADRQTIAYDGAGAATPATQTTTFTAQKQNTSATVTWSLTDAAGAARTPVTDFLSAETGNAVTMTEAQFASARGGTSGVIVTATLTDGATLTDKISVVRVAAGATGATGVSPVTVTALPEAVVIQCEADGSPKTGQLPAGIVNVANQGGSPIAITSVTLDTQNNCTASVSGAAIALETISGTEGSIAYTVVAAGQSISKLVTFSTVSEGTVGATSFRIGVSTPQINYGIYAAHGGTIAINASSTGKLKLNLTGNYRVSNGSGTFKDFTGQFKIQLREAGGTWADVAGTESIGTPSEANTEPPYNATPGGVNGTGPYVVTGLAADAAHEVRFMDRKYDGSESTTSTLNLTLYAEQVA